MKKIINTAMWEQACLDTPFGVPKERSVVARHPDDLLDCPGVCLKTKDGKEFGKLVHYDDGELVTLTWIDVQVVVRSHDPATIWVGTVEEYKAMWIVD